MRLRLALITLIAAGLTLSLPGEALACVCAGEGPRKLYRASDAAIIGRFIRVENDYEYRVLRVYKGRRRIDRGEVIAVDDGGNPAAGVYTDCAPGSAQGRRYGLFLDRRSGRWLGSACATVVPWKLSWAAAQERERTSGAPPSRAAGCSASA
jgi:hypothetical protein